MAAPVPETTWYSYGDIPFPDTSTAARLGHSIAFLVKAMISGGFTTSGSSTTGSSGLMPASCNWKIVSSSDSSTVGAGDILGATFDGTKWVNAAGAHTWYLARAPSDMGMVNMCVDLASNSAGYMTIAFWTGSCSAGTTSARPTGSMEFYAGSTSNSPVNIAIDATTTTHKFNFTINTSGAFHVLTSRAGTGIFYMSLGFYKKADLTVGDLYPWGCTSYSTTSGRGAPLASGMSNVYMGSRTYNMTSIFNNGGLICPYAAGGSVGTTTVDVKTNEWPVFPAHIWDLTTSHVGYRGRIPDFYITGAATIGGSVPQSGSQNFVVAGDMLLPFTCLIST